jgi:hypothetical protein
MRPVLTIASVLFILALVAGAVIGCGGKSGPEAAVAGVLDAMEAENAEELGSYFTEDLREYVMFEAQGMFDIFDKIEIDNLQTKLVSQAGNTATVRVDYDYAMTALGETTTDHHSDTIDVTKVGDKWLISEALEQELE